jgi:hypothetical protein
MGSTEAMDQNEVETLDAARVRPKRSESRPPPLGRCHFPAAAAAHFVIHVLPSSESVFAPSLASTVSSTGHDGGYDPFAKHERLAPRLDSKGRLRRDLHWAAMTCLLPWSQY